jgi:hypothetical protein
MIPHAKQNNEGHNIQFQFEGSVLYQIPYKKMSLKITKCDFSQIKHHTIFCYCSFMSLLCWFQSLVDCNTPIFKDKKGALNFFFLKHNRAHIQTMRAGVKHTRGL